MSIYRRIHPLIPSSDERSPSHKKGSKPPTAEPKAPQRVVSKSVTIRYQCEFVLTLSIRQPPSLFALIIAINKYKSALVKDLKGSIADAEAVKSYLQGALGVPPSRIKTLFNEHATCDGIIKGLRALKNADIKEGDPILIFYAGHGVAGDAPKDRAAAFVDEKIELIAPHDMDYTADKSVVNAIPDRTMGILLGDLAKAKGDNIVRLDYNTVGRDAHLCNTDGHI
jgi:hypothetical protein